ncbi:MAG TPA: S8 family peptidase, partial [Bacteroidales bacterium]|nr:S8 family peptidase [Bacteroidales bacterium]
STVGPGQFGLDIINYATFNRDVLVVAAAGNENSQTPFFPASFPPVLSVAATNSEDLKWSGSSFNRFVDLSAPGQGILSTFTNGGYIAGSGTSMATPVVAGAAAILRHYFPHYSARQIAAQLKVTADSIYHLPGNIPFTGMLGTGRLNLHRALTETHHPYVDFLGCLADPELFANSRPGQRVFLASQFQNLLIPANITVKLTSLSEHIIVSNQEINLGTLQTGQITNNENYPFILDLSGSIPLNHRAMFMVEFISADGKYAGREVFGIVFNTDFVNLRVNRLATTVTSRGTIGFNYPNLSQGLGFIFRNGRNLVSAAGLMVGLNVNKVVDNLYGSNPNTFNQHFVPVQIAALINNPLHADVEVEGSFTDAGGGLSTIGVSVNYKAYKWRGEPKDKFIILEYHITNTTQIPFHGLHAGFYADWIISEPVHHRAAFDASTRMGYAFSAMGGHYTGISLLSPGHLYHYAVDNSGTGSSINVSDGFTDYEKYNALRSSRATAGENTTNNDISTLVSSGPHSLAPGQSMVVAFALLAGDHLPDLINSALAAQTWYQGFSQTITVHPESNQNGGQIVRVFPVPFDNYLQIEIMPLSTGMANLSIIDLKGRVIWTHPLFLEAGRTLKTGFDLPEIEEGIFLLRLEANGRPEIRKIHRRD